MAKVILHEVLYCAPSCTIFIIHAVGNFDLHVERQLVGATIGKEMQVTPYRPKEPFGLNERVKFLW